MPRYLNRPRPYDSRTLIEWADARLGGGANVRDLAWYLGVDPTQVYRWRRGVMFTEQDADEWAVRQRMHISDIWGRLYWDLAPEGSDQQQIEGWEKVG